jgi:tetratricopeptide (TPR) repeat protein
MLKHTLACLLTLVALGAYAQQQNQKVEEYRLQQEQVRKTALLRELDSAVVMMDDGQYEAADKKFRHVLENIRSVPSDLVFYFGKNSYYMEKYKQCIDWLTKYIQLKGTNGQYSEEAAIWLKKAEGQFVHERAKDAQKAGEVLSVNYDVDCGPAGKVVCPVCKGDHVVIKPGPLGGNAYKTCPYCNEQGILTCDEYNKLVRGQLKPKQ